MFSTRHHRGPLRSVLVSLLAIGIMGGTVLVPRVASADSIDDKRRQAANIADQLDNLTEQMDALGEDYSQSLTDQADLAVEIDRAQADVAAAEAQQFFKYLERDVGTLRVLIEECKTKQAFVNLVAAAIEITRLKENLEFRKKRVRAIAMSFKMAFSI